MAFSEFLEHLNDETLIDHKEFESTSVGQNKSREQTGILDDITTGVEPKIPATRTAKEEWEALRKTQYGFILGKEGHLAKEATSGKPAKGRRDTAKVFVEGDAEQCWSVGDSWVVVEAKGQHLAPLPREIGERLMQIMASEESEQVEESSEKERFPKGSKE